MKDDKMTENTDTVQGRTGFAEAPRQKGSDLAIIPCLKFSVD